MKCEVEITDEFHAWWQKLYAFDHRRIALLLLGGRKIGEEKWYEQWIPVADRSFDEYLGEIDRSEGEK